MVVFVWVLVVVMVDLGAGGGVVYLFGFCFVLCSLQGGGKAQKAESVLSYSI